MMRSALIVFCVCCVATVMSELFGFAFLWYRGQLSTETMKDIRLALSGENREDIGIGEDENSVQLSIGDVTRNRTMRVLELDRLQTELDLLKNMIDERKDDLKSKVDSFNSMKTAFETRLKELEEENSSKDVTQARGILGSLSTPNAVGFLMELSIEQAVVLLDGMPEKSIAKILEEFVKGQGPQLKRGQQIFEKIYDGGKNSELIQETQQKMTQDGIAPQK